MRSIDLFLWPSVILSFLLAYSFFSTDIFSVSHFGICIPHCEIYIPHCGFCIPQCGTENLCGSLREYVGRKESLQKYFSYYLLFRK